MTNKKRDEFDKAMISFNVAIGACVVAFLVILAAIFF